MSDTIVPAFIFWFGVCTTLYAYVGFPVLMAVFARSKRTKELYPVDVPPMLALTVVIPAFNEERSIEAKIRNTLDAQYPSSLLEVIVVSDASTDATDTISRRFEQAGVRLIAQEVRRGKTAGLNRAVAVATGEIIVFTDANAAYPLDTLARLTRYFSNPRVGLVSGYTRYTVAEDGHIAEATNAYTTLERVIKRGESRWGRCVGADGAIFAMRRSLYRTLRDDDINDFVLPLAVIEQGYQCLFADEAFCIESAGKNVDSEFRRQSRITNRTLRALWRHSHLLNPVRFPAFAPLLFSHKVARFLVPVTLLMSGIALAWLEAASPVYRLAAIGALVGVVLSGLADTKFALRLTNFRWGRGLKALKVFVTVNVAVLDGWRKFLTGRADVIWHHDRSARVSFKR